MKYTLTNESITVVTEDGPVTVRKGQPNFEALQLALVEGDESEAMKFLTVEDSIEQWSSGKFTVQNGEIHCGDEKLPVELSRRITSMVTEGTNPGYYLRFWERLQLNPSWRSVTQVYRFLENQNIPVTEDGCFLAYKSVRRDLTDHHTGKIKNDIGIVLEMPRNKISDDPKQACHFGFHVGSINYAQGFHNDDESRLLIVKVDPADVVCVPYDANSQKVRVCKYKVIGFYGGNLPSTSFKEEVVEPEVTEPEEAVVKPESKEEVTEPKEAVVKPKEATKSKEKWGPLTPDSIKLLDAMGTKDLIGMTILTLRRYASHLKVVQAYHLPGGKTALIKVILKTRP